MVAFDKARLSDTGVSDYYDLQKLLVGFTICGSRAGLSGPLGWAAIRKISASFYMLFWNEISPILNFLFFGLRSWSSASLSLMLSCSSHLLFLIY